MEEFLIWLEENHEDMENVFNEYYYEKANELGEEMQGDERYYGDDGYDMSPSELYEDFAHCHGHEASYYGASGVVESLGEAFDVQSDDEDLQWEIMVLMGHES